MNINEAYKIHGIDFENEGYASESDSGKSFDDEYLKYKPQPLEINRSKIITIRPLDNVTNLDRSFYFTSCDETGETQRENDVTIAVDYKKVTSNDFLQQKGNVLKKSKLKDEDCEAPTATIRDDNKYSTVPKIDNHNTEVKNVRKLVRKSNIHVYSKHRRDLKVKKLTEFKPSPNFATVEDIPYISTITGTVSQEKIVKKSNQIDKYDRTANGNGKSRGNQGDINEAFESDEGDDENSFDNEYFKYKQPLEIDRVINTRPPENITNIKSTNKVNDNSNYRNVINYNSLQFETPISTISENIEGHKNNLYSNPNLPVATKQNGNTNLIFPKVLPILENSRQRKNDDLYTKIGSKYKSQFANINDENTSNKTDSKLVSSRHGIGMKFEYFEKLKSLHGSSTSTVTGTILKDDILKKSKQIMEDNEENNSRNSLYNEYFKYQPPPFETDRNKMISPKHEIGIITKNLAEIKSVTDSSLSTSTGTILKNDTLKKSKQIDEHGRPRIFTIYQNDESHENEENDSRDSYNEYFKYKPRSPKTDKNKIKKPDAIKPLPTIPTVEDVPPIPPRTRTVLQDQLFSTNSGMSKQTSERNKKIPPPSSNIRIPQQDTTVITKQNEIPGENSVNTNAENYFNHAERNVFSSLLDWLCCHK